jgi:hypothetical protein
MRDHCFKIQPKDVMPGLEPRLSGLTIVVIMPDISHVKIVMRGHDGF